MKIKKSIQQNKITIKRTAVGEKKNKHNKQTRKMFLILKKIVGVRHTLSFKNTNKKEGGKIIKLI